MALPVNVAVLQTQPMTFSPNMPPCIPNVRIHELIAAETAQVTAAALASVISNYAVQRGGAMWHLCFNLVSANQYYNDNFSMAFKITTDVIAMRMISGGSVNIRREDFDRAVNDGAILSAAYFVNYYIQDIAPYLSESTYADVQTNMRALGQIAEVLANEERATQYRQQQQNQAQQFHYLADQSRQLPYARATSTSSIGTALPYIEKAREVSHQSQIHQAPQNLADEIIRGTLPDKKEISVKEQHQSEPAAANGRPIVDKGIENMDRAVHQLAYASNEPPAEVNPLAESFRNHVNDLTTLLATEEGRKKVAPTTLNVFSIEQVLSSIQRSVAEVDSGEKPATIVLARVNFVDFVYPHVDLTNLIERLSATGNLHHVATQLTNWEFATLASNSEVSSRRVRMVIDHFARIITEAINDMLRYDLGETCFMDNFMTDLSDMEAHFRSNKEVSSFLTLFNLSLGNSITSMIASDPIRKQYSTKQNPLKDNAVIARKGVVAYVALTHQEMGYEISKKPMSVSRNSTPFFFELIKGLEAVGLDQDHASTENYIVTADGAIYRVSVAAMHNDQYIITRVR